MSNQPLTTDDTVLLFNGDLFMDEIAKNQSDTDFLFRLINNANDEIEFLDIFKLITGPFSIICYFMKKLYIARDSLGRNSLIIGKKEDMLFFTSVLQAKDGIEAIELPPLGVYSIHLDTREMELFPFKALTHDHTIQQLQSLQNIQKVDVNDRLVTPTWLQLKQISFDFSFDNLCDNSFEKLLEHPEISRACDRFIHLLSTSTSDRVKRTQKSCKLCINKETSCSHSHIGVLFSGGVDCSILTILADKFVDADKPIDLMNVAFEKAKKSPEINWNVPDRLTGLETLKELQELCPNRKFNFIEINVDRAELQENAEKLSSLVYPLENILDESLGAALYFASRGKGQVDEKPYQSQCRVLLMGSGADEAFGGYTRHRNAFKRGGSELLGQELLNDWIRLPSRNLARDDRVIGDNGITVRAPFVEENFVNFAQSLKPLQRCYPALEEGDKLLLRLSAFKLGLIKCCNFRKRALQFGSRIADSRQNAKDKSNFLQHTN